MIGMAVPSPPGGTNYTAISITLGILFIIGAANSPGKRLSLLYPRFGPTGTLICIDRPSGDR